MMKSTLSPQVKASRKALAIKSRNASEKKYLEFQTPTPGKGRVQGPTDHNPVMGAFEAEGNEPVLRRSRHVR